MNEMNEIKQTNQIKIRTMEIDDYEQVRDLWMTIKGFAIRSLDDSKDGVAAFKKKSRLQCGSCFR